MVIYKDRCPHCTSGHVRHLLNIDLLVTEGRREYICMECKQTFQTIEYLQPKKEDNENGTNLSIKAAASGKTAGSC